MNRRSAKLSTNYYRSKFILRPDFSEKFILRPDFSEKFILRPDFSEKFILRFVFLDITVLYSIGKRYNYLNIYNCKLKLERKPSST